MILQIALGIVLGIFLIRFIPVVATIIWQKWEDWSDHEPPKAIVQQETSSEKAMAEWKWWMGIIKFSVGFVFILWVFEKIIH